MDAFRQLAQARAGGALVPLPRTLTGDDRRIHVRRTIRKDHQLRIARHNEEAFGRFDKLAASRFSFFRGTALLSYRGMVGEDAWMPTVLAAGDVHPENFGVMLNADNVPIFAINDYDEVFYAPFTWDLKRGATGFPIAAEREHQASGRQPSGAGRSWFRDDIDLDDLSFTQWRRYAEICGGLLAHALSDEAGLVDHDVEPDIVDAMGIPDLFVDDVVRFAEEADDRCSRDHEAFRADRALGAFRRIDLVYR